MTAAELTNIIGADALSALSGVFGGQRIYIPGRVRGSHVVVSTIGLAAFKALVGANAVGAGGIRRNTVSGGYIDVPIGDNAPQQDRSSLIETMIAEGSTNNEIARAAGIHTRSVARYRRRVRGL